MFLRRKALDKVGLLDESFFMYGEDIDLSYRIVQGGYVNYYIPERILHYKGESTKHGDIKYVKAFYGAMLIFYRKYYPHSGWLMSMLIPFGCSVESIPFRCRRYVGVEAKTPGETSSPTGALSGRRV